MFMQSLLDITFIISVAWLLEPLSQGRYHSAKPIEVEHTQRRIADHIRYREPRRYWQTSGCVECSPDVLIHPHALIGTPDQATSSESRDERDTIDQLCRRARHAELIHEPMNVEKGSRQLIKDEV